MQKEKYAKSKDGLSYSGNITLKLLDGDRVLAEQKYHNTGRQKLFNFFAQCLSGDFEGARSARPCRVVLFKLGDGEGNTFDETKKLQYWNDDTKVSTQVFYDSALPVRNGDGKAELVYHFRLPFLSLVNGEEVGKVGLYPNVIGSLADDICAYYYLAQPFPIPDRGGNFTVVIDWVLTIENKGE